MKVIPLLLAAAVLPAWAGPNEDCSHSAALLAVRGIVYDKLMPASFRQDIARDFFLDATAIGMAAAVNFNRDINLATCEARMTVDATYGLDKQTDQSLQMVFARNTDELRAMVTNNTETVHGKYKMYGYTVRYTVQPVSGDTMIRVNPLSPVNATLVEGFARAAASRAKPAGG